MKRILLLLILSLLFNSCKKDGQQPCAEPSLTTQILIEVYGIENLEGDLFIAINNSSEQFISNTECYRDTIIDITSNSMIVSIEDVISGTCC